MPVDMAEKKKKKHQPNAKQTYSKGISTASQIYYESWGLKEILTDTIRSKDNNKWQRSRKQQKPW